MSGVNEHLSFFIKNRLLVYVLLESARMCTNQTLLENIDFKPVSNPLSNKYKPKYN